MEAIAHLEKGLELIQLLPESTERAKLELALQFELATSLVVPRGPSAPEVEQAYVRALALCREVGETATLIPVLQGLRRLYALRGDQDDGHKARKLGEQLLALAQQRQDNRLLQEAHWALGQTLYYLGELDPARSHLERSSTFYTPHPLTSQENRDAAGTQIANLFYLSWASWALGYPERALETARQALSLARELAHPFTLGFALWSMAKLHQFRREADASLKYIEAQFELCTEHQFSVWINHGMPLQGWALAMQGNMEEGIAKMQQLREVRSVNIDNADLPVFYRDVFR